MYTNIYVLTTADAHTVERFLYRYVDRVQLIKTQKLKVLARPPSNSTSKRHIDVTFQNLEELVSAGLAKEYVFNVILPPLDKSFQNASVAFSGDGNLVVGLQFNMETPIDYQMYCLNTLAREFCASVGIIGSELYPPLNIDEFIEVAGRPWATYFSQTLNKRN